MLHNFLARPCIRKTKQGRESGLHVMSDPKHQHPEDSHNEAAQGGTYELDPDATGEPAQVYREVLAAAETPLTEADTEATEATNGSEPQINIESDPRYLELKDRYLRALADLDNARKRQQREALEWRKFGHEHAVRELLPVLDNLERALAAVPPTSDDERINNLVRGVDMIRQQFLAALERLHVRPVPDSGERFDPFIHEAVSEVHTSEHPPGHVVHALERGYTLHDRLLRPAKVVVAAAIAAESSSAPAETPADADDAAAVPTPPEPDKPASD